MQNRAAPQHAISVIRVGWFGFEGFGRPYEGWVKPDGHDRFLSVGRTFTRRGAAAKAFWAGVQSPPPSVDTSTHLGASGSVFK